KIAQIQSLMEFKIILRAMAFEDEADRAEFRAVLEARPGEPRQELNDSERAYLADTKEVGKLLGKSWMDK
ncbi:hypothetical protein BGZ65_006883, partial [Modicella reniformis]